MNSRTSDTAVSDAVIRAEQIDLLYGSAAVQLINLLAAPIVAVVLWSVYPAWIVIGWLVLVFALNIARLLLWRSYQRQQRPIMDADRWGRDFVIGAVAMGALWGVVGSVVFLTDESIYHVFAAFLIAGMTAGAAMRNSAYAPAYYGFVAPAVAPIVTGFLVMGNAMAGGMGVLFGVFTIVLLLMGRDNSRRIVENIRMRIAQSALNAELQSATRALTREVGERRQVAAELEESSERFRAIGESAQDPIIITDADDHVVYWNPAAERAFGYTQAEIIGQSMHDRLAPERYRDVAKARYKHFAGTGQGVVLGKTRPLSAMRKDGSEFPVELSISSMRLGGRWHALGIARDISERELIEAALRERGEAFKEAQRLAHVGNWMWQPDTDMLEWSEELYRIFGRDLGQPAPSMKEHAKFLTPESFARLNDAMRACQDAGRAFAIDLEGVRADGSTAWISTRGEAHRVDGRTVRIRGTAQDITERKTAEAKSREAEATFRALVEQGMSGILMISEDGTLAYANPRFAEMIGFDRPHEAIGRPVAGFVAEEDRPEVTRAIQAIFSGRAVSEEVTLTVVGKQGATVDALTQGSLATFNGKRVVIAVVLDITERRRSEERIRVLHEQMTATVSVLRRRERDQTAIARLSDILQSCHTVAEAYPIIASTANRLFRGTSGALAGVVGEKEKLQTVAEWGGNQISAPQFIFDDCWALRTGQRHEVDDPGGGTVCRHFKTAPAGSYICLPLTVHGETTGLLHLDVPADGVIDDDLRQLMVTFGDVVKLSLSNLTLRETLSEQAMRDALTGLFNRHYLAATLPREVKRARRNGTPLTVAMLDIDHFKKFNDSFGHDAGDMVLRDLGGYLRAAMRSDDIACRYGGEEFLLVLPECDLEDATARMQRLCLEIKQMRFVSRGQALPNVTISVGLAQRSDALASADALISAADQALYAAKRAGRDRVEAFPDKKPSEALALNA